MLPREIMLRTLKAKRNLALPTSLQGAITLKE
jgi:hypothetical protein